MLINDVLDLAKIEAGSLHFRDEIVDVRALVRDCARLMEPRASAGELTIETEVAPDAPDVRADPRAMKQIVLNLVSNAIKFTPTGGTVTIFARGEKDGALSLGVRDTGIGIAESDHARVFENFGQGRHDVTHAEKGTGLGLPIVKGLTEAHGGKVALESKIGSGTCVTIRLPAERVIAPALRNAS